MTSLAELQRALSWDHRNLTLLAHRLRQLERLTVSESTRLPDRGTVQEELQRILTSYLEPAVRDLEALAQIVRYPVGESGC